MRTIVFYRAGNIINSELEEELPTSYWKIDEEKSMAAARQELTDEDLEEMIGSIGFVTFNITENCNNRCIYCIYSGDYENTRTHSQKKMSFKTARKTIDYLIEWISSKKRKVKQNAVNLGSTAGSPSWKFNR